MNLTYEGYNRIHIKISSKHDSMHNNDVNYALKSLKINELNV